MFINIYQNVKEYCEKQLSLVKKIKRIQSNPQTPINHSIIETQCPYK